jgi:hypothetical protein
MMFDAVRLTGSVLVVLYVLTRNWEVRQEQQHERHTHEDRMRDVATVARYVH